MANQTTSIDYKHPYATILWQHKPTGGEWQDAINLSGYVGGQGTKTLELSGATEAETGHLRCALTNPAGAIRLSELAALSATATAPEITIGISNATPYQGNSATYGPITAIGTPTPDLLWEAETADGNNTWADADTVFGADGSGQGTDTYIVANTEPGDNRDVRVTATNTQGSAASQAALTVTPTLAVTGPEPTDKTITATASGPAEYLKDFATDMTLGEWANGFSRNSLATAPNAAGTIITYQANEPAWYKDQGLQLEDESTNMARSSETFSSDWTIRGAFITNETSPDPYGTNTATEAYMFNSVSNDAYMAYTPAGTADAALAPSFFVYSQDGGQFWHRNYGNIGVGSWIIDGSLVADGYHRITSPDHPAVTEESAWFASSSGRLGQQYAEFTTTEARAYLFGSQLEVAGFASSYIPSTTPGVTYTRAATACTATFTELGAPLPAGGVTNDFCGQIPVRLQFPSTDANSKPIYSIGDMTNGIAIAIAGTTLTLTKYVGGSPTALSLTVPAYVTNDLADIRYRISATDMKLWLGNALSNANANGTALAAGANTTTLEPGFIVVSKVRLVPEALSDEDIEAWT